MGNTVWLQICGMLDEFSIGKMWCTITLLGASIGLHAKTDRFVMGLL